MEPTRISTRSKGNFNLSDTVPSLPTRELSGRKRVKKSMGPDFVEDFTTPRVSHQAAVVALKKAAAANAAVVKEKEIAVKQEKFSPDADHPHSTQPSVARVLPGDVCQICRKKDEIDSHDALVHCRGRGCQFEAHISCLKNASENSDTRFEDGPNFKCAKCKRCCVCGKKKPPDPEAKSVTCSGCNRQFHMRCHFPHVTEMVDDWKCTNCSSGKSKGEKIDFSIRKSTRNALKRKPDDTVSVESPVTPVANTTPTTATTSREESLSSSTTDSTKEKVADLKPVELPELKPELKPEPKRSVENKRSDRIIKVKKTPKVLFPGINAEARRKNRMIHLKMATPFPPPLPDPVRSPTPDREVNPYFLQLAEDHETALNEERELRLDLAMWSVEQCAAYFMDSMPGLAALILQHELFGSSLMIISRKQFTDLFSLPVGKILLYYNAIAKWRRNSF